MKSTEVLGHIIMLCVITASMLVALFFNKQLAFAILLSSCIVFVPLVVVLFLYKDKKKK